MLQILLLLLLYYITTTTTNIVLLKIIFLSISKDTDKSVDLFSGVVATALIVIRQI